MSVGHESIYYTTLLFLSPDVCQFPSVAAYDTPPVRQISRQDLDSRDRRCPNTRPPNQCHVKSTSQPHRRLKFHPRRDIQVSRSKLSIPFPLLHLMGYGSYLMALCIREFASNQTLRVKGKKKTIFLVPNQWPLVMDNHLGRREKNNWRNPWLYL